MATLKTEIKARPAAKGRADTKSPAVKKAVRGRPTARDTENRRGLLLDAALALFASRGIAATSLNAIARQAQVTPALVHYYFGNREQLVEALLTERIVPVVDDLSGELTRLHDEPLQAIYALTRRMLATLQDVPWLPPLWVREVLCEGGLLRAHLLEHIAPAMAKKVQQLAAAAQRDGQLNPALDPRLVIVSLIGLTLLPLAAAPIWRQLPGYQSISAELLAQHMLELLAHGIENNNGAAPTSRAVKPVAKKVGAGSAKKSTRQIADAAVAREKKHAARAE